MMLSHLEISLASVLYKFIAGGEQVGSCPSKKSINLREETRWRFDRDLPWLAPRVFCHLGHDCKRVGP